MDAGESSDLMMPADETKPNIARMYDYWLGGKDNYEADRVAAEAVRQRRPNIAEQALDNKRFQTRAITYVAGQGVRQFLDIGSGLPTSPVRGGAAPLWRPTHEAARAVIPDALVAYVDDDPVAMTHSRALLAGGSSQVVATAGDMRDAGAILASDDIRGAGFSLAAPACVIMCCVLHFLDAGTARGVVQTLTRALAPGSYVIISVGFGQGRAGAEFARTYNAQDGPRIYAHSLDEITALFDGLDLVPPGLADAATWQAESPPAGLAEQESMILAGVGRRASAPPAGGGRDPALGPGRHGA
jgi:SAM-dependent methyltransferase